MKERIPLSKPFFDEEEIYEVQKVLESGWVTSGPKVKEFEQKVIDLIGVKHAIAVSNCTSALHLALLSLGIKEDDEVIVADYSFPATANAVVYCGAKPIFCDIDTKTYNINPDEIHALITHRTKAIIPVHTFGQMADMDEIKKIAGKIPIIEDAACAFGSKYKNQYAGTMGDIGCFSFHARKGITTGEGGMVVTNDDHTASWIRYISQFGMSSAWSRESNKTDFHISQFNNIGYNYKMSDITAAVGVAQLKKLDQIIEMKRYLAKYWDDCLDSRVELISKPYVSPNCYHTYQSYVALVDKKIDRNKLIVELDKRNIQTQIGTYSMCIQPVYKARDKCPVSEDIYNRAIALPLYYSSNGLNEDDIEFMVKDIKEVLKELV